MDPARFQQIRRVFEEALEQPAEQRDGWLRKVCGEDIEARKGVESLLQSHAEAGGFLQQSPVAVVAEGSPEEADVAGLVGPYQVLRRLGRGGMGEVFLAVRHDDAFRKLVALKIARHGQATEDTSRRFRQERQVLAALDHPNIARILDGGTAEDGRLYYVMEYVDGQPITDYCERNGLDRKERLRLFCQVCQAVDYLHTNQIIHRDLKPGNILVTHEGTVKLLDFGIAKLKGFAAQIAGGQGEPTMIMTPGFASPEQMEGEELRESSDVYSLTKVLCLVLGVGLEHQQDGEQREPHPLSPDLEAILKKGLRKEPAQRYQSAKELEADLRRFLEGRPVTAQEDTLSYRMSKYVKRNRLPMAAGVIFLAVVLFAAWQALQSYVLAERIVAKEAEIQRLVTLLTVRLGGWQRVLSQGTERLLTRDEKLHDVGRLVQAFRNEMPDVLARLPGATPTRKSLISKALAYLDHANEFASNDPELRREIALGYRAIGDLQGNPQAVNLGDRKGAVISYQLAGDILASVAAQRPDDPETVQSFDIIKKRLAALGAVAASEPSRPPKASARNPSRPNVTMPAPAPHYTAPRGANTPRSVAAFPSAPEAVGQPPQWGELEPLYAAASAKVAAARKAVDDLRLRLTAMGQSPQPSLLTAASNAEMLLDDASRKMAQGDGAAARDELRRAEQEALRLLRRLGR